MTLVVLNSAYADPFAWLMTLVLKTEAKHNTGEVVVAACNRTMHLLRVLQTLLNSSGPRPSARLGVASISLRKS